MVILSLEVSQLCVKLAQALDGHLVSTNEVPCSQVVAAENDKVAEGEIDQIGPRRDCWVGVAGQNLQICINFAKHRL